MFTIRMTTCIIYTIFNKTPRTVYFWNNSMQNQLDTHAITEVYLCHITRFEIYHGLQTRYASYNIKHTTVPANLCVSRDFRISCRVSWEWMAK